MVPYLCLGLYFVLEPNQNCLIPKHGRDCEPVGIGSVSVRARLEKIASAVRDTTGVSGYVGTQIGAPFAPSIP